MFYEVYYLLLRNYMGFMMFSRYKRLFNDGLSSSAVIPAKHTPLWPILPDIEHLSQVTSHVFVIRHPDGKLGVAILT